MKDTAGASPLDSDGRFPFVGEKALLIAGWSDAAIEALGAPARTIMGERFWRLDAVTAALDARCDGQARTGAKTGAQS